MFTNEPPRRPIPEGYNDLGVEAEELVQSDSLYALGFRYGAPIYRATATFTRNDMSTALVTDDYRNEHNLIFMTTHGGPELRMRVTSVRRFEWFGGESFLYDLFVDPNLDVQGPPPENVYILEGFLLQWYDICGGDWAHANGPSLVLSQKEERQWRGRVWGSRLSDTIKVLAVVLFDEEGHVTSAIVQCPPTRDGLKLHIPAL